MSRPPRPHGASSTTGEQRGDPDRLDYLPSEYADLFELQRSLAEGELDLAPSDEEGDFLSTLMELSSVVGHILAVYQDRYAGEAFLSTATAQSSLVRHARRLAYVPDAGVSATGAVVLTVKDDLDGSVGSGLALASAPRGTVKAQDFETLSDLEVSATVNALTPDDATRPVVLAAGATTFAVQGTGHGLEALDVIALVAGTTWQAFTVKGVKEEEKRTLITTFEALSSAVTVDDGTTLYAKPTLTLHPFGWSADPSAFPPDQLKTMESTEPGATAPGYWYKTYVDGAVAYNSADIYLDQEVKQHLVDSYVVRQGGSSGAAVLKVTESHTASVAFYSRKVVEYQTFEIVETSPGVSELVITDHDLGVDTHISGTVTAIRAQNAAGTSQVRTAQPFPALWLAGFKLAIPLCATEPNEEPLVSPIRLKGELPVLAPGRLLLLSNLGVLDDEEAGDRAQLIEVSRVERTTVLVDDEEVTTSEVYWEGVSATPDTAWQLHDVLVYGNVAEISHGRTVEETLGSSDGVTAFQRFKLKQSPVTHLSDDTGASPVIELRVNDVAWTRVTDFWDSGPNDRHYRLEIDEELVATAVFGDGQNGSVPPAGTRNVKATYRVGVGTDGNVGVGRVSRIKKAHPLLKSAYNFTSVTGGAAAATADEIREQATRYIRTFDRAVSVSDYADLALLYPGVARAAARWDQARGGVVLVAATSTGETPAAALVSYLDQRRDTSIRLFLETASARLVTLNVHVICDAAYLPELVKQAVRDALYKEDEDNPGLFTFGGRALGQQVFLSEVYALIEGVDGVVSAVINELSLDADGIVYDVLQPELTEWLSMDPNSLTISVEAEEA